MKNTLFDEIFPSFIFLEFLLFDFWTRFSFLFSFSYIPLLFLFALFSEKCPLSLFLIFIIIVFISKSSSFLVWIFLCNFLNSILILFHGCNIPSLTSLRMLMIILLDIFFSLHSLLIFIKWRLQWPAWRTQR